MSHFMEGIVRAFIDSKLTPLTILAALCLGIFAIVATPREEEPQIIVPMIDVFVELPGAANPPTSAFFAVTTPSNGEVIFV